VLRDVFKAQNDKMDLLVRITVGYGCPRGLSITIDHIRILGVGLELA